MIRKFAFVVVAAGLAIAGAVASFGASDKDPAPTVHAGFKLDVIAHLRAPREIAVAPNGDLLVGSAIGDVYIVPHAEDTPGAPSVFVHLDDAPVAGVALANGTLFIGGQQGVWTVPYQSGDQKARAAPVKIASVRTGGTGGHSTTSVAVTGGHLFVSIGSSCNVCDPELDATRASIQEMDLDGKDMHAKAIHIRNAIALTVNRATGTLWAGVAGQDELAQGHPYEIFDPVTAHAGTVDYGWPHCYENHRAVEPGRDCSKQTPPRVVFPAYETPIGAAFYPVGLHGRYAFGAEYAGGAFVALHGSWHVPVVPPRVAFVPMTGDEPKKPVDWNDPAVQWDEFAGGFESASGARIGRPTGIAVGPEGSLFVADDKGRSLYRIRPN